MVPTFIGPSLYSVVKIFLSGKHSVETQYIKGTGLPDPCPPPSGTSPEPAGSHRAQLKTSVLGFWRSPPGLTSWYSVTPLVPLVGCKHRTLTEPCSPGRAALIRKDRGKTCDKHPVLSLYPGTLLSFKILFYLILITILLYIGTTIICFMNEEIKAQTS